QAWVNQCRSSTGTTPGKEGGRRSGPCALDRSLTVRCCGRCGDRRTNELLGDGGAEVTDPEREDRIVRTVGGGRARHCRGCERPTEVNHRARAAASAVHQRAAGGPGRDRPAA